MKAPSELMSDKYCGPSKLIPLGQIRNEDGFRFIGIDKDGGDHFCIVRRGDSNSFYMNSNTALFSDLIGWIPDAQASNAIIGGRLSWHHQTPKQPPAHTNKALIAIINIATKDAT